MSAIAAIHVAKKQLGLDDDTYRAVLVRVTGKNSTKEMTEEERNQVVSEFRKQGFKPASKGVSGQAAGRAAGRYRAVLQALWIDCWNLGLTHDRTDAGLTAFVKRQAKVDHTRFLVAHEDATKVIEALKGWMAREAKVDWSASRFLPAWTQGNGYRVARAQFAILARTDAFKPFSDVETWLIRARGLQAHQLDARGWIGVMNDLGRHVRKAVR